MEERQSSRLFQAKCIVYSFLQALDSESKHRILHFLSARKMIMEPSPPSLYPNAAHPYSHTHTHTLCLAIILMFPLLSCFVLILYMICKIFILTSSRGLLKDSKSANTSQGTDHSLNSSPKQQLSNQSLATITRYSKSVKLSPRVEAV